MFQTYTSFVVLDAALLVAIACIGLAHRGRRRRRIALALGTLVVCQVLYLTGIYLLVAGPLGGQFQSYPRYSATMLTAASVLLVLLAASHDISSTGRRWRLSVVGAIVLVFLTLSFPLRDPISYVGIWAAQTPGQADKIQAALADSAFPEEHPVVALIFRVDSVDPTGYHHGVYYRLLGTGARVHCGRPAALTPEDSVSFEGEVASSRAEFRQYLIDKDVRFILVAEENAEFGRQFAGRLVRPRARC